MKTHKLSIYGGLFVVVLGGLLLAIRALPQPLGLETTWKTEVHSNFAPAHVFNSLRNLSNWPRWIHDLKSAQALDMRGVPYSLKDQILMPGSLVQLQFLSKNSPLKVMSLSFTESRLLRLAIVEDPTGRFSSSFSNLIWEIEIVQNPDASTQLQGTLRTKPKGFSSQLLSFIIPQFYLKAAFLPNLKALAEISDPLPPNPIPVNEQ